MKKIIFMTLALAANLSLFAQENEDMGNDFSLDGRSLAIFRSDTVTKEILKSNAKATFWSLTGKDGLVMFCAKDAKSNETVDSLMWFNARVKKSDSKGNNIYMVHDEDSVYMKIIGLGSDIYAIQIHSQSVHGTTRTSSSNIEILDSVRLEADPLLSRNVGRMELRSNHIVIEIHDDGTVKWWLRNPPHIFVGDRWALTGDRKVTCKTKVGIYKADGQMLAMTDDWKGYPSEHGTVMNMYAKCKMKTYLGNVRDYTILEWLLTTKQFEGAYMRVVSPVYGDYLMDVKFRIPDRWYIKQN